MKFVEVKIHASLDNVIVNVLEKTDSTSKPIEVNAESRGLNGDIVVDATIRFDPTLVDKKLIYEVRKARDVFDICPDTLLDLVELVRANIKHHSYYGDILDERVYWKKEVSQVNPWAPSSDIVYKVKEELKYFAEL